MTGIGLVLGAGGISGHAFESGVLAGLAEVTGWDPRTAEVVAGTSAGSRIGALLRAGVSGPDLFGEVTGGDISPSGRATLSRSGIRGRISRQPAGLAGRLPAPVPLDLLRRLVRHPWLARGGVVAAAVPPGRRSAEPLARAVRPLFDETWPKDPLWISAVRLPGGERVVFGMEDAPSTDVGSAVAASCAIPGYFAPVEVAGERYVDGGAYSPTNADLLAGLGLDLVVVVSPMSTARHGPVRAADRPLRLYWRMLLAGEARRVERSGTPVVAFQPTAADQAVMGLNALDPRRASGVARQARQSTLARLAQPNFARRLDPLRASGPAAS